MGTKVALLSLYNHDLAFGVRSLSSALWRAGHHCDIIFFKRAISEPDSVKNLEVVSGSYNYPSRSQGEIAALLDTLRELKPDFVGISLISAFFELSIELTENIRETLGVPIIWGGIHPTLFPENCIIHADFVCIGEGDEAVVDLANVFASGGDPSVIENLWSRRPGGEAIRNEPRPLVEDLDSLGSPDFEAQHKYIIDESSGLEKRKLPSTREHPDSAINIMSSRGCPFSCTYCCNNFLKKLYRGKGPIVRRRSVQNVLSELNRRILNGGIYEHVHFWDDVFTFDKGWIEVFAREYGSKIAIPFTCYAHPTYTDQGILQSLKESGLYCVNIGIQSGSSDTCRNVYKRKSDNRKLVETALLLKELDIMPWYDIIVDNPYERDGDYKETLGLLLELPRPFETNVMSLCYFPRTELTERALCDKLITEDDIDGKNTKALDNWRASAWSRRENRHLFWVLLIAITKHRFIPKRLIAALSRSGFFKTHPRTLRRLLVFVLALAKHLSVGRKKRAEKSWRKKEARIETFAEVPSAHGNRYLVKIACATGDSRQYVLSFRSYPFKNPHFPERFLGAWDFPLEIDGEGASLQVDLSLPDLSVRRKGEKMLASHQWTGPIRENGLYGLTSTLHRNSSSERTLDSRSLSVHSLRLFGNDQQ